MIAATVIGATGYVGGELLRLIATHPEFELSAAVSSSRAGQHIGRVFPHLASDYREVAFSDSGDWLERLERGSKLALFSAAPHGASAAAVAQAMETGAARDVDMRVVDSSADFRYSSASEFAAIYGVEHPVPQLLDQFLCALPEHVKDSPKHNVGHPGCFATAILLAAMPLVASGSVSGELFVSGITGSTGSGRSPQAGTHHPERHSNLYAYKPHAHRHVPEVENLLRRTTKRDTQVLFVPHSGPFARGIHVTVQAKLADATSEQELRQVVSDYYADAEFVEVVDGTPRLKDVVASNYCHIGVAVEGEYAVVMSTIDNLVKGAAGGAMQWMNRLWAIPECTGLQANAPAWT
ncbi:MAG: N-acetyl-gamma-glutamyl-phosphate reductase [Gammaproteobacteria bacterium]|nr:N-acetyl-gamma-glutamyl-phosphate reductase [Gammaproteobacteria bacterium]